MYLLSVIDTRKPETSINIVCALDVVVRALPIALALLVRQDDFESLTYDAGTRHYYVRSLAPTIPQPE